MLIIGPLGIEVCVDVTYEPSKLGVTRTNILVTSPTGGDYTSGLYGQCTMPRPQGPILVKLGQVTMVSFKNVYMTTSTFFFSVDNPQFSVKATETIASKKTVVMSVSYNGNSARGASSGKNRDKVAKLTVSHPGTQMQWIYYIKV